MRTRANERQPPFITDGGRDSSRDLGQERHRILRELRPQLTRHPAIEDVQGIPDGKFRELRADINPSAFGRDAERATLRVAWWPAPEDSEFAVHYSESTGYDCGFHREPNPHVDGKAHFQERSGPGDDYEYESVSFSVETPSRLLWTILDQLSDRLQ